MAINCAKRCYANFFSTVERKFSLKKAKKKKIGGGGGGKFGSVRERQEMFFCDEPKSLAIYI